MPKSKKTANKMQRDINNLKSILGKQRMGDYRLTGRINDSLYGSLLSTYKGRAKRLSASQERTMSRMQGLVKQLAAAGRKDVSAVGQQAEQYGDFGGMLASSFATSERGAQRSAQYGNKVAEAGANYGRGVAKTGLGLMQLAKSGVQEARAGAQYETAQALALRTKEDVAMVAEQQLALDQMELQHQFAMEESRVQFQQAKELEEFRAQIASKYSEQQLGTMRPVEAAKFLASAASQIMKMKGGIDPTTGQPYSATAIVAEIAAQFGVQPNSADHRALGRLVQSLTTNDTPGVRDDVADEVLDIIRSIPGWEKLDAGKKRPIREMILAMFDTNDREEVLKTLDEANSNSVTNEGDRWSLGGPGGLD